MYDLKTFRGLDDSLTREENDMDIVNCKIVAIRPMTKAEQSAEGWRRPATVLVLDNGTLLYPSRDSEGNDAGALFGKSSDGSQFALS
jgi:hypothetical protein